MSLSSDIEDIGFAFEKIFFEDPYDDTWTLLKSSKNKDSILHRGFITIIFVTTKSQLFLSVDVLSIKKNALVLSL